MSAIDRKAGDRDHDAPVSLRTMPRWYTTLFVTDTLERFGFYGMQAILVLYASAPASRGGLGLGIGDAAALFGAWISVLFMLSLPGGWVGDRWLGQRRAMLGGCLLSGAGYLCLAVPSGWMTAVGLVLLAMGGGLFKPNHQAMINLMFGGSRGRESGISLMYVGVQVSALLAPLVTGYLGERVDWNLGFSVAAVAVLATAVLLARAAAQFGVTGSRPDRRLTVAERRRVAHWVGGILTVVVGVTCAALLWIEVAPTIAILTANVFALILPIVGYTMLYRNPALDAGHRQRLRSFLAVLLGATLFWMIIAHAASLLNLFARDSTDRNVFGFVIPASWLLSATPLFILLLAPAIATVLPRIGGPNRVAVKFSAGLLLVGGGFLVMAVAALLAMDGSRVSPLWLIAVYLTHACGEVVVAAVTISSAAEVLPRQFMGRLLGLLWLFAALGGGIGSVLVRMSQAIPEPVYYLALGSAAALVGGLFAVGRRALRVE